MLIHANRQTVSSQNTTISHCWRKLTLESTILQMLPLVTIKINQSLLTLNLSQVILPPFCSGAGDAGWGVGVGVIGGIKHSRMMTSSNGNIFPLLRKGQRRGALVFFICAWTNGWSNNRGAGDLGRHCAHYDVTVMAFFFICSNERIRARVRVLLPWNNLAQFVSKPNYFAQ